MDSSEEALSKGSWSDSELRHSNSSSFEQSSENETADEEIIFSWFILSIVIVSYFMMQ